MYATADRIDPAAGWDADAHQHLSEVGASFASVGPIGPGAFGTGAVLLAFRALSRGGTRYRRAESEAERVLRERLRSLIRSSPLRGGLPTATYDLASGVAGALITGLATADADPSARQTVIEAAAALSIWARHAPPEGLWTPPTGVTDFERAHRPETASGYVDLGYAHGVAGVLAALGGAHRAGITVDGLDDAIDHLRAELTADLIDTKWGVDVPYRRTAAVYSEYLPARTAWCYGGPGVALALAVSARDRDEMRAPEQLWRSSVDRPRAARNTAGAGICHGTAGLLLVGRALSRAGLAVPDTDLLELVGEILDQHDDGSRYGFRDLDQHGVAFDSAGFLQGAAGVAAALLSITEDDPSPAETIFTGVADVRAR
ncbi:hypothetical protein MT346_01990 [Curtobacterium sp. VKM Ac-2922]|nr:hypothetical protein [Curtobacterium sp. VKM Ac-2922]